MLAWSPVSVRWRTACSVDFGATAQVLQMPYRVEVTDSRDNTWSVHIVSSFTSPHAVCLTETIPFVKRFPSPPSSKIEMTRRTVVPISQNAEANFARTIDRAKGLVSSSGELLQKLVEHYPLSTCTTMTRAHAGPSAFREAMNLLHPSNRSFSRNSIRKRSPPLPFLFE